MAAFISNVPLYFTEKEINDFENFLCGIADPEDMDGRAQYFVLISNNKIIGCGGFGDKEKTGIISLAWGLVHKNYQKKRFGEQLLRYRLEKIKKCYPSSRLIIDTTQFSYSFFEKYGFTTVKITEDFYDIGMHRYDMELQP